MNCPHCGDPHDESLKFCPKTGRLISAERLYPPDTMLEGKYRLRRALGVGGMGAVFEATHVLLDKRVAIKLLLPDFAKDQEMCARLIREARAASATGHRNIVAVSDMGHTDDGTLFVVMEYVQGRTLKQVISTEAPMAVSRAVGLVDQVLSALEVVHRKGIVHRDLKPANLLLFIDDTGEETVKILDFGISKITGEEHVSSLTTVGKVMGTPRYMSPEQAVGQHDVDHRADIYACGVIFYELVTGDQPFPATSFNELIAKLLHGDIVPPSQVVSTLPPALDRVVLKALSRAREQRYASASELRRALKPFALEDVDRTRPGVAPAKPASFASPSGPPAGFAMDPVSVAGLEPEEEPVGPDPAPPPGAPKVPSDPSPEVQAPPDDDAPLELAVPTRPTPPQSAEEPARAGNETLYRPSAGPSLGWLRWVAGALVVVGVLAVLWRYSGSLRSAVTGKPGEPDAVMLLVETDPQNADIFVDGVLAVTRPIQLPRTASTFTVRVQAPGYLTKELDVVGDKTRVLRVKLRRRRR